MEILHYYSGGFILFLFWYIIAIKYILLFNYITKVKAKKQGKKRKSCIKETVDTYITDLIYDDLCSWVNGVEKPKTNIVNILKKIW